MNIKKINNINFLGLKFLGELSRSGKLSKDNYYKRRFDRDEFLSNNDIKIISYIDKNISKDISIFEPGSGYSQVPLALSILGYKVFALEVREDRYKGSLYFKDKFSKTYGPLNNLEIAMGRYPKDAPKYNLINTNNFASTFNRENEESILNSFRSFHYCILDARLFGFKRSDEDVVLLVSKLKEMGFLYEKCFDDFYIIRNT
jgi:hypothetical protein